jgi:hypothetical protein
MEFIGDGGKVCRGDNSTAAGYGVALNGVVNGVGAEEADDVAGLDAGRSETSN